MTRSRKLIQNALSHQGCQKASSNAGPSNDRDNPATDNDRPQGRPGLKKAPPALRAAFVFRPVKIRSNGVYHALARVSMASIRADMQEVLAKSMAKFHIAPADKTCTCGLKHGTPAVVLPILVALVLMWPAFAQAQQWARTQPSDTKPQHTPAAANTPPPKPPDQTKPDSAPANQATQSPSTASQPAPTDSTSADHTAQAAQADQADQPASTPATTTPSSVTTAKPAYVPAAPPKPAKKFADYLVPELLLYAGVGMILLAGVIWIVRKSRELAHGSAIKKRAPTQAGFSIDELEKLRDQGLMNEDEFTRAMKIARAQARKSDALAAPATDQKSPVAGAAKPSQEQPQTRPPTSPAPGQKSSDDTPPSGSSPDTRNGELW